MNYDLEQRIRTDLQPDEKLLWTGQPAQGFRLRGRDFYLIPFSLFWLSFMAFWEWTAAQTHAPLYFRLFGIPFVLIGLHMLVGRFFVDAVQRSRTYYGLTSTRPMILSGVWTKELKSLWLRNLAEVSLREGPGPRGTIQLGPAPANPPGRWSAQDWAGGAISGAPAFDLIEDARRVYELLEAARRDVTSVGA